MVRLTQPANLAARFAIALGLALLLPAGASTAHAQGDVATPTDASRAAASTGVLDTLGRRGDLTLRDATLESALFTISELWGVNIVAGKVEGAVNGVFKDAPLRDILDSILLSNGYAYRPVGGSLVVSRLQELGQINPFFVSETIPVGAADVDEVVDAARLMSTPQGQVRALPSAGAVLVVDFPDRVKMVRDLVKQLDSATRSMVTPGGGGPGPKQLEVAYFRTHFVTALQASTAIDIVLSTEGRISTVEAEDRLLVIDYPANVRMIESVLARIDRPRPQVNIKALIYDISLGDMEQMGVNWNGVTNGTMDATGAVTQTNTGLQFLTQTATPLDASATGGAFTFYSLGSNLNLQALVVALQQAEDSRLLADPNVTVMDNEPANIESISEIPFQQLTQTTGGGNIGTTAFKEVGIKLDVTPKIARDGTIDMTVVPEFSRLAGYTPGDNQPIIEKRTASTRVRVVDGQTLMIAGLRQRTDVGDFDGVPLLKDIRFIGHLFRSRSTQIVESELVVFITPEIVGYNDPLGERNQLSSDTVGCRLDQIPAAEGCPCCRSQGPCACTPAMITEAYETILAPEPPQPTPMEAESQGPSLPSNQEQPAEVVSPLSRAPGRGDDPARDLRRLPTVQQPQGVVSAAAMSRAQAAPERPLRVNYDARFRATGGVHADEQRLAERPADKPTETAEAPKKKSVGDWLFWR